jgi:hypothetical protein
MDMTTTTISIDRRFAGPPFAANGGYFAGMLAEHLGTRHASVDLMAPVPLERPIEVEHRDGMGTAWHQGTQVARVVEACPVVPPVAPTDFVTASVASGDVDPADHPFPGCFVCGPDRAAHDGMHLLPGRTPSGGYAVPWVPEPWQADPTGTVSLRMVTAALDCPSGFAVWQPEGPALLAGMTFQVDRLPNVGEHLVVTAQRLSTEGRKLHATSVIHDPEGHRVAMARALWVELASGQLETLMETAA